MVAHWKGRDFNPLYCNFRTCVSRSVNIGRVFTQLRVTRRQVYRRDIGYMSSLKLQSRGFLPSFSCFSDSPLHREQLLFSSLNSTNTQWGIPQLKGLFVLLYCFTLSNNVTNTKQWHTVWYTVMNLQFSQLILGILDPLLVDYYVLMARQATHCIITNDDIINVIHIGTI